MRSSRFTAHASSRSRRSASRRCSATLRGLPACHDDENGDEEEEEEEWGATDEAEARRRSAGVLAERLAGAGRPRELASKLRAAPDLGIVVDEVRDPTGDGDAWGSARLPTPAGSARGVQVRPRGGVVRAEITGRVGVVALLPPDLAPLLLAPGFMATLAPALVIGTKTVLEDPVEIRRAVRGSEADRRDKGKRSSVGCFGGDGGFTSGETGEHALSVARTVRRPKPLTGLCAIGDLGGGGGGGPLSGFTLQEKGGDHGR